MAKTTTVTASYTSNIVVNGITVSADKIYVNGTQVRRCIVNGTDVIHKSVRTVVKVSSDLTFNITVRFTAEPPLYFFTSPIYADITVTDNGSSGFTSVTCVAPLLRFYCSNGDHKDASGEHYYERRLLNQSLPIGQTTTLEFSGFKGYYIFRSDITNDTHYYLSFQVEDPDEASSWLYAYSENGISRYDLANYRRTTTHSRVIDDTLSDNTVQEY